MQKIFWVLGPCPLVHLPKPGLVREIVVEESVRGIVVRIRRVLQKLFNNTRDFPGLRPGYSYSF